MELTALAMRIGGLGAVSPAGWGVPPMLAAVRSKVPLPHEECRRVAGAPRQRIRRVPKPPDGWAPARAPRMRRTSPISGYLVAAALEALGPKRVAMVQAGALRVGVIVCLLNGCVVYSRRFYAEVLADPATASPLLFPETVFNAPASHLAALLGAGEVNYTLVGDTAQFPAAFDLASLWLEAGEVDGVLVAAAEEADWLSGEAAVLFDRDTIVAEGAGAVYVEPAAVPGILVAGPVPVGPVHARGPAARSLRARWRHALGDRERGTLLCDGAVGGRRGDAGEAAAFSDWAGPRISTGVVLGDGLGTRAAWQCVAAAAAVADGSAPQALVSAIGTNQQALGLLITRPQAGTSS